MRVNDTRQKEPFPVGAVLKGWAALAAMLGAGLIGWWTLWRLARWIIG